MQGNFNWPTCPAGTAIQYSTDNGATYSATEPDYTTFPEGDLDVCIKCVCIADTSLESAALCETVTIVQVPECCDLDPTGTITVTPGTCS